MAAAADEQLTWSPELTRIGPGYIYCRPEPPRPSSQDRTAAGLHCTNRPTNRLTYSLTLLLLTTPCVFSSFSLSMSVGLSRCLFLLEVVCCVIVALHSVLPASSSSSRRRGGSSPASAKLRLAAAASSVSQQQSSTVKLRRGRELPSPVLHGAWFLTLCIP